MGTWNRIVNVLVVLFASFFVFVGLSFLLLPLTGWTLLGHQAGIEGGASWDKALLGLVFLLAAAPMYYYIFSKNAKSLPPPVKRPQKKEPPAAGPPPT